jgi:hypothetical protein
MTPPISTVPPSPVHTGTDQARGEEALTKARDITQLALSALEGIKTGGEVAKLSEAAESSRKILDPDPNKHGESHISLFLSRTGDELFNRVVAYLLKPDKSGWPYIDRNTERDSTKWTELDKWAHTRLVAQMPLNEFTDFLTCVRDQIKTEISQKIIDTGLPRIVMGLFEKLKEIEQEDFRLSTLLTSYADEKYKWQQQDLATIEPVLNLIQERLTESRSTNDGEAVAEPSQADAQEPLGLIAESSLIVGFPGNASIVMPKIVVDQVDGARDPLVNASTLDWRGQADSWQEELIVPTLVTTQTEDPIPADDQKQKTAAAETTSEVVGNCESDNQATVVGAGRETQTAVEARSDGREHSQPGELVGEPEIELVKQSLKDIIPKKEMSPADRVEWNKWLANVIGPVEWLLKRDRIETQSPSVVLERLNGFRDAALNLKWDHETNQLKVVTKEDNLRKLSPIFWGRMVTFDNDRWSKYEEATLDGLRKAEGSSQRQETAVETTSDGHASIDRLVATQEGRVMVALKKLYPKLIDSEQSGLEMEDVVQAICFLNKYGKKGAPTDALQNRKLDRNGEKREVVLDLLKNIGLVDPVRGGNKVKLSENLPELLQAALHPNAGSEKFLLTLGSHPSADAPMEHVIAS